MAATGEKVFPPKFLEYEYAEAVLVRLDGYSSQGGLSAQGNRLYFDPNSIVPGRKVIGIELFTGGGVFDYNQVQIIVGGAPFRGFTMTLVDTKGNEVVKDIPIMDLSLLNNGGRTRVFNVIPVIEKCYLLQTGAFVPGANQGFLFNFFTIAD